MKMTQADLFEEKVFAFIGKHRMLRPAERVVAGISGGADSVCLLFVLLKWRERYGMELSVVHVDHGIRAESGEDARFVEKLCARYGIPFYLRKADVRRLAAERKCSEEEAGRDFRYRAFEETARERGADRIAVAHNMNDCSETMLFHLFRGTGLKGLAGIPPVRGRIIRPLLCVERGEIEHYLEELGQDYCRDETNSGDRYTRNRIRHHILPYAERELVEGCVRHMARTAELVAETEDYMARQTEEALQCCVAFGSGESGEQTCRIDCETFERFHPAIRKRMLYELIGRLSPGRKDIARVHVEDLQSLFERREHRRICLPFGICGRREYDRVILERERTDIPVSKRAQPVMQVFPVEELPRNYENSLIFPKNQYTKWFDYDKIKKSPVLRTRREGDYLTFRDGEGNLRHKKLKEYMVAEKIPGGTRDGIPVLAEDSHVLWVVGYRISEYYKIGTDTKRVLQVTINTEEKDG
ncbi:MAG: tRNA lysidine(34) synthetase TilS [Acetatifactor muris]|nr:tRNA lysidine(34) synthetase TilS [Acetatifactor muris]MCM1528003.1 tRNA lysidine(34) synthetase TilS [Bacteroides sp.]